MTGGELFVRSGQTVRVRQCVTADGPLLFVMGGDEDRESRAYCFRDLAGLRSFRERLESFLLDAGWRPCAGV
jgi:hypothetical protein